MSEIRNSPPSPTEFATDPAFIPEVAAQYQKWASLAADLRCGKQQLPKGSQVRRITPSRTVLAFGKADKPTTTYEFDTQPGNPEITGALTIAVTSWLPDQSHRDRIVRDYVVTEDGSKSAHAMHEYFIRFDEEFHEIPQSIARQPRRPLDMFGLHSLETVYQDLQGEFATAKRQPSLREAGATLVRRLFPTPGE